MTDQPDHGVVEAALWVADALQVRVGDSLLITFTPTTGTGLAALLHKVNHNDADAKAISQGIGMLLGQVAAAATVAMRDPDAHRGAQLLTEQAATLMQSSLNRLDEIT